MLLSFDTVNNTLEMCQSQINNDNNKKKTKRRWNILIWVESFPL